MDKRKSKSNVQKECSRAILIQLGIVEPLTEQEQPLTEQETEQEQPLQQQEQPLTEQETEQEQPPHQQEQQQQQHSAINYQRFNSSIIVC